MKLNTGVAAMALSIVGLVAAGCTSNDTADNTPPATTVIATAPGTTTTVSSSEHPAIIAHSTGTNAGPGGATGTMPMTADAINAAIVHNTQMTGSRVTAVVDNAGVATLTGFVQNAQQKALAEKTARDAAGINGVKNKLDIRPTGGTGKTPPIVVSSIDTGTPPVTVVQAAPAPTPPPHVVVVNNYVPVPTQQQPTAPPVNVIVPPPANNGGGGNGGGNGNGDGGSNDNNNGSNFTDDGSSSPSGYNMDANGDQYYSQNAAVMNSELVPNYLRNMALSRDYEMSRYPVPYGYGGVQSYPNPSGNYGFPSSYGSNGGYPIDPSIGR